MLGLLLLVLNTLHAQRTIRGTIRSAEDQTTIPFVNITVQNSTIGVYSDELGQFELVLPKIPAVVQFSLLGYETQKLLLPSKRPSMSS